MFTVTRTKAAVMASLMACLAACSSTRTQKSAGEQIDDTMLTMRVKAALVENPSTKARDVVVEVFRGIVQLNELVDTASEKSQATTAARSVSGVRDVRNNLAVTPGGSRTTGTTLDDTVVTARVKTALAASSDTNAFQVNVDTRDGVVQLSGFVDKATEKSAAEREARKTEGVRSVRNEIDVKR